VERWEKLLKAAFAHRRKMLRSSLPPELRKALEGAEIDGTKRAEALGWDEWARFARAAGV
jgi:16S rRNA A1518/A1519 N6-dimethyltransferase RsmA/KsgA/DIM1 with predicted DNA glycosylase/AP lyase activity